MCWRRLVEGLIDSLMLWWMDTLMGSWNSGRIYIYINIDKIVDGFVEGLMNDILGEEKKLMD